MKTIFASVFILVSAVFTADARIMFFKTFRELEKWADLVVVATPVSTKDTEEHTVLPHIAPDNPVVGLSTEFEVSVVLKGDDGLKKIVVHHYRLADPNFAMRIANGPNLASFDSGQTTRYLLFLRREADGRYAPPDQDDPVLSSMFKLSAPGWDKMTPGDFREWLDAMKWIDKRPDVVRFALSAEIPPGADGRGNLQEAALNGKLEKARDLIKNDPGLVFNQNSSSQQTPLHLAVEFGHKDVAELLLANNANVEATAYGGWTPLLQAVFGSHKDEVELLLEHHARVNVPDNWGRTPLHVAVENGYTGIAKLLLANKADVNARRSDGLTPLHVAASLGNMDIAVVLVDNGANINAKSNEGRTPLDLAVKMDRKDVVELLRARQAAGAK